MALFPQFPNSNLHELNLDWIIEQIRQIEGEGVVLSVNGLSGVVTLYTDKDVVFPDLNYNDHWQIFREIDNKIAGLKFTGEKFFYITKNEGDDEFTVQEVYTSGNQPPYPVTSVNERTGNVVLAGDNILYNIDGTYTIEDVITPLEKSIGHVIRYNTCADGVSAGQYVYLILSGISGRSDGLYKAVNAKSAGTVWTAADLDPVAGGLGALMASLENTITKSWNVTTTGASALSCNTPFTCPADGYLRCTGIGTNDSYVIEVDGLQLAKVQQDGYYVLPVKKGMIVKSLDNKNQSIIFYPIV